MSERIRLDALLAQRGLFPSRSRAAAAVMAGDVRLCAPGARTAKPGQMVLVDAEVEVTERARYVSRGGIKLENALALLHLDVSGRRCLDAGASTGGFTDCLLQAGASEVVAVDVGYGELAWSLREDSRVHVMERTNARELDADQLPYRPDLITADLSFISLTKVIPALIDCAAESFDAVVMVKPQFEVGRDRVGRGGVVRDPELRKESVAAVAEFARERCGASVLGFASSGLPGPKGNQESFVHLAEATRAGALENLGAALDRAEL
jgi:23S rRNA (cytidine1920-2'-O)/16S rRNA (cytidine1409-2'-O)-methyltransferase